jgi:hypothetical protein
MPHFMPKWDASLNDAEMSDLAAFRFSLKPKSEKLDF